MRAHTYKAVGINLKSFNLGNSDKIITVFTREYGKIKVVAKGSRKPSSKFGGRLELFGYNNYFISRGKSLDILSQAETIESFLAIRENYERIQFGLYILWAINKVTVDDQENPALFDLLLSCLKALSHGQRSINSIKRFFQEELLRCEGIFADGDYSEKEFDAKFFDYVG
ncbi:MAG: DNA repair protein RecO [Candidatus Margulisiibacteriota bacterium]